MAVYNEILTGALNQVLARRLGVQTGGGAVSPSIAPEIFATLPLEVDRPEWAYLAGERIAGAATGATAQAALNTVIALSNPNGSNVLMVVEFIRSVMGAGSSLAFYVVPNTGFSTGTLVGNNLLDSRWMATNAAARAAGSLTWTNLGAPPAQSSFYLQEASTTVDWTRPIILQPSHALVVFANTVNVAISRVAFQWRERALVSGELG